MAHSLRPRRTCRDRPTASQPTPRAASSHNALRHVTNTHNFSSPRLIQPSPTLVRSRSRTASQPGSRTVSDHIPIQLDTPQSSEEYVICPFCAINVNDSGLICDHCNQWFHYRCLYITDEEFSCLSESTDSWFCDHCKSVRANRIKWGVLEGEETIRAEITRVYNIITSWRKNIFLPPRGKAGTDFIKELSRLIDLFVNKTRWKRLAIPLLHVFMPLMLQKPSKSSKAKDHAKYLESRLGKWKEGNLKDLLHEGINIQKRLSTSLKYTEESNRKAFCSCRLMLAGEVKCALGCYIKGVHRLQYS